MARHILVHGLGQRAESWGKLLSYAGREQVFDALELSELLAGQTVSYETLYHVFSVYCDHIEEPLCIGGLSLGAVLALHYSIEHPEKVKALVLMAAQYAPPKALMAFQNVVFRFLPKASFRDTGFGKEDFIRLCKTIGTLDLSEKLDQITCPVLVVCGEKDRTNLPASQELARQLPGAVLRVIPGCGHEINAEAPETLAALISDFYHVNQL